jgi:hypothetical protein
MSVHTAAETLGLAAELQRLVHQQVKPPSETAVSYEEPVVYMSLVQGTRSYIVKTAHQANGAYQHGWYDACAVMIRRLVETLLIECYERHKIEATIKDTQGNYLFLRDLVDKALAEPAWTLGRNVRAVLPKLKDIGDKAAHNRRFNAIRQDIDKLIPHLRETVQELIALADLKHR